MSSVPASRSSRKPKESALASRFAFQYGTAMLRMLVSTTMPPTTKPVSARPALQSSRSSSARMPTSSSMLPSISKMNSEKNVPSSFGSPSTRSIISPGVRSLWYDMSSDSACAARSSRMLFVAVHATRSEKYVAKTCTTCWSTAMTMKALAAATSASVAAPACASSMKYRMICGRTSWRPRLRNSSTPRTTTNGSCGPR